jgi:RNA polymerase sigma-70 factor (ECF subfamily)
VELRANVEVDDQFVDSLKKGNADAFEELVRRFEAPLYRFFLAAHGDPQLAGEQSADCFGDLVASIPKMVGGAAQLRAFVFAVAKNVLRGHWRLRARERNQQHLTAELVNDWATPDFALQSVEEGERVIAAIRLLDPSTRDVFLLRFVEQMPLSEISTAVSEPIGTVKSRLYRGRQRLQAILQSMSGLS